MIEVLCEAQDTAQLLCLAETKPWAQFPALHKFGRVLHTYNLSAQEAEIGNSEI